MTQTHQSAPSTVSTARRGPNRWAEIVDRLACPHCRNSLTPRNGGLECASCKRSYPVQGGIPDLRLVLDRAVSDLSDWSEHWSDEKQTSLAQRFFSVYRKVVFARTVAYFSNRYFPAQGVLVEAGSGTSETSILIDKCGGQRTLAALDIVLPVLTHTDPVMDICLCGDIFHLPFGDDSLDGMWNVGVMEHFTHPQIDAIMGEFRRVLKPGARLVLLWPGTYSIPQRMLRIVEWFVNRRKPANGQSGAPAGGFRFHPPEISQLRSTGQGREVLQRNGFKPVAEDAGLRSLMAFVVIVGEK